MASLSDYLCDHRSWSIRCRCGIVWFTHGDDDYHDLCESATRKPKVFRQVNGDSIDWGWLFGQVVVDGCDECVEFMNRYEGFIVDNEEKIRGFLRELGKERVDEAHRLNDDLSV